MFKKLSIRTKLITLMAIVIALMMTSSTVVTINLFKNEVKDILQRETAQKVEFLNSFIDNYLQTPMTLVENTAKDVTVAKTDKQKEALENLLEQRASGVKGVLGLHVAFDGDKKLYSSEHLKLAKDYDANERDWYKAAKAANGQIVVTDPYEDAITGKQIVGVSQQLKNGRGIVTIDLDLAFIEDIASGIKIGDEGYAFVLDKDGNVLYHPDYDQGESVTDFSFYKDFMANKFIETENRGEDVYLNRFYNEKMNWQIGSYYSKDEITKAYKGLVLPVTILNTICILIMGALFYLLITKFLKPLSRVTKVASQVAEGNLKEHIDVKTEDEIGKLSMSFNDMTDGLKEMIHHVDDTSNQLSHFSADVSASVEENVQSIHQVVSNIQQVAHQSKEQLASASYVQDVVNEMGREVSNITENMDGVKDASKQAEMKTTEGVNVMENMQTHMTQIETSAQQTSAHFNDLMDVANDIDKFSKVIGDIAGQTNLLALNASIEAARAGDHGKGFAVVAEEVRKLAEQTNDSACQIQSLVSMIQHKGATAHESIHTSNKAVVEGMNQIQSANEMFNEIHRVMDQLAEKVDTTQSVVESLQQRKEETIASVEEITLTTTRVNHNIEQVAATTEQQNASMEQMATAAEQLATQAQQLQQTIRRFEI